MSHAASNNRLKLTSGACKMERRSQLKRVLDGHWGDYGQSKQPR